MHSENSRANLKNTKDRKIVKLQWYVVNPEIWNMLENSTRSNRLEIPMYSEKSFKRLHLYLQRLPRKIWNRVDCQRSEKRFKTHKRLKERFLIRRNWTKRAAEKSINTDMKMLLGDVTDVTGLNLKTVHEILWNAEPKFECSEWKSEIQKTDIRREIAVIEFCSKMIPEVRPFNH